MCDSDVLDLLFNQGGGILDSQVTNKKGTEMADFDFNSLPADLMIADLNGSVKDTNKLDLDLDMSNWGYLKQTDEDMFFNSLLNSNLPDDVKQSQHMKHIDHAYSTAPAASPKSDSGISNDPSSPLSFNSSVDDLTPLSFEEELFGPLELKTYDEKTYDDMDTSMMADQGFPDSNSEDDMSPGLDGNESPISFDFEPIQKKSGKIIINTTPAGSTKLIKVLSVNQKPNKPLQSLLHKPAQHSSSKSGLQELVLSDEEKELLRREGVSLPSHLPLTREEEKILRSVRRRIRNKASARNSRKKKQDYMEALEDRVKRCTDEKLKLEKKVNQLEKQNSSLMGQLRRLQKLVTDGTRNTARTGTCAMILALSFALVLLPNYQQLLGNSTDTELDNAQPLTGRSSRTLLQTNDLNTPPTDCIQNTNSFLDFFPFLNKKKSLNFDSPCLVDEDVDDYPSDYKTIGMKRSFRSLNEDYDLSSTVQDDVIHMEITKLPDGCKEGVCTPSPPSKKAKISV